MKEYTYYAFISYKREDESWAKWMQDKLEYFKLPTANENAGKEYLRPIFRDITDLRPGVLSERIKDALDNSKFLIAICSPRYSKSRWCDEEIKRFIETGKASRIIPFIIDGTPYSDEDECFPPSLKQLRGTEYELLGADVRPISSEYAFIQVIASMLDINVDFLWKRYLRNEEIEKQKIKEQNDRLLTLQSRIIAAKARDLIENWPYDEKRARNLILEALPTDAEYPERPWISEAEYVLRSIIKHKLKECEVPDPGGIICYSDNYCVCSGKSGPCDGTLHAEQYTVRLYKIGKQEPVIVNFTECVWGAGISQDGSYMAISTRSTLVVYDIKNQVEAMSFGCGHIGYRIIEICHKNRYIACASSTILEIFDIKTGDRRLLSGHSQQIMSIEFDKTQNILISSSLDKKTIIWDLNSFKPIGELLFDTIVTCAVIDLDSDNLLAALDYRDEKKIIIKAYSASNYDEKWQLTLRDEEHSIQRLHQIADLNMLVVENVSGVYIYDLRSGIMICSYPDSKKFQLDETAREITVVKTGTRKITYQIMSRQQMLEYAKSQYASSSLSIEDKTYFCLMK